MKALSVDGKGKCMSTSFSFCGNAAPLRTVIAGKSATFSPVMVERLKKLAAKAVMTCDKNHKLVKAPYYCHWERCKVCKKYGTEFKCEHFNKRDARGGITSCYWYNVCSKCVAADKDEHMRAAEDPKKHETCLTCAAGTSLSLMIPEESVKGLKTEGTGAPGLEEKQQEDALSAAAKKAEVGASFSLTAEVLLPTLPPRGMRAALFRFSPPLATTGRAAKRQTASIYVTHGGAVVTAAGTPPKEISKQTVLLRLLGKMGVVACALKMDAVIHGTTDPTLPPAKTAVASEPAEGQEPEAPEAPKGAEGAEEAGDPEKKGDPEPAEVTPAETTGDEKKDEEAKSEEEEKKKEEETPPDPIFDLSLNPGLKTLVLMSAFRKFMVRSSQDPQQAFISR